MEENNQTIPYSAFESPYERKVRDLHKESTSLKGTNIDLAIEKLKEAKSIALEHNFFMHLGVNQQERLAKFLKQAGKNKEAEEEWQFLYTWEDKQREKNRKLNWDSLQNMKRLFPYVEIDTRGGCELHSKYEGKIYEITDGLYKVINTFRYNKECNCSLNHYRLKALQENNINTAYNIDTEQEIEIKFPKIEDYSHILLAYENKINRLTKYNNIMVFVIALLSIILIFF